VHHSQLEANPFETQYYQNSRLCIYLTQPFKASNILFQPIAMSVREPLVGLFSKSFEKPSDLLCCAFGLRNSEIDTYFSLISGPKTVEQITELIGKDRSTVTRVLNRLYKKNLVERNTHFIERGGYYYEYSAKSTDDVREEILAQLEKWYKATRSFLKQSWPQTPQ
jgi:predicted transcriptional regulator